MTDILRYVYGADWSAERKQTVDHAIYDLLIALNVQTTYNPSFDPRDGKSCIAEIDNDRFVPIIRNTIRKILNESERINNVRQIVLNFIAETRHEMGYGTAGFNWRVSKLDPSGSFIHPLFGECFIDSI